MDTRDEDVQDLPEHVGIMVVDTKGFSRHNDRQQNRLAPLIHQVLRRACDRSGLSELWEQKRFPDSTGDGFILGFPPSMLPRIVFDYLDHLQAELYAQNRALRADGMTLRMRLSLELGPVALLDDILVGSPVGKTMIDTHRLVDADAVRALLDRSEPEVTFLAAALSESVMEAAVRSGYSRRHPAEFVEVTADIGAKGFSAKAYLRVPRPSGDILRHGLAGIQPRQDKPVPGSAPVTHDPRGKESISLGHGRASRVGDVRDGSVAAGDVAGNVGVLGPVSGNGHAIAARDLDQSTTIRHTGRDSYEARGGMTFDHRRFDSGESGDDRS